jgi:hypothetical protein
LRTRLHTRSINLTHEASHCTGLAASLTSDMDGRLTLTVSWSSLQTYQKLSSLLGEFDFRRPCSIVQ